MTTVNFGVEKDKVKCLAVNTGKECAKFNVDAKGIEMFVEYINKVIKNIEEKPLNLHENFVDWDKRISRLDKTSRRLIEIDEEYNQKYDEILTHAKKMKDKDGIDVIKNRYGGNNDKTRKKYVDENLTELLDEKKELEFRKTDDNRRISLLKRLIDMKIELIKYSGCDEEI